MGIKRRLKGGDYNNGYNSSNSIKTVKKGLQRVRSLENIETTLGEKRSSIISSKTSDYQLIGQLFNDTNILYDYDALSYYINDTYESEPDFFNLIKKYLSNEFFNNRTPYGVNEFKKKYSNLLSILKSLNELPSDFKQISYLGRGGLKRKTRRRKTYRSKSLRKKKD